MISDAPLPPDAIGLADAFQRVCIARISEWPAIQTELEAASEALREAMASRSAVAAAEWRPMRQEEQEERERRKEIEWEEIQRLRENAQERLFDAKTRADRILREALAARDIRALIRNPATGEVAEITNSNEWQIDAAGLGRPASELYEPGFSVNHVSEWRRPNQDGRRVLLVNPMPEQPGPPSHFGDGVRCPVFLRRLQFEEWLTVASWDKVVMTATTSTTRYLVQAILTEWPNGRIPSILPVDEVCERIRPHYRAITERAYGKAETLPSAATVRRQLGREKKAAEK